MGSAEAVMRGGAKFLFSILSEPGSVDEAVQMLVRIRCFRLRGCEDVVADAQVSAVGDRQNPETCRRRSSPMFHDAPIVSAHAPGLLQCSSAPS
jgi:hypothetical protein